MLRNEDIVLLPYTEEIEPFIRLLEAMIKLAKSDIKFKNDHADSAKRFLERIAEWC